MSLASVFLARRGDRGFAGSVEELGAELETLVARGAAAWPTVELAAEVFVAYLAERAPSGGIESSALARMHIEDLYIACACATGNERAIEALDARYLGRLDGALHRLSAGSDERDDVKQLLRIKLFTPSGEGSRKISDYSGRAGLAGWLRVVATRIALNARRGTAKERPLESGLVAAIPTASDDPEIRHLRELYREEVALALRDAFHALSKRQRNLLRLHHFDRLAILELASLYDVHRVTASRWLDEARAELMTRFRELLTTRLRIDPETLTGIIGLVQSRFDVSLTRLFHTVLPADPDGS